MSLAAPGTDARPSRASGASGPRFTLLLALGAVVWGLAVGLQPLHDNSFFTHLATGRLILEEGIPRADPFSFTAPGMPWVVQSWLASVVYAVADRVAGGAGLLVVGGALTAAMAYLVTRLVRPCDTALGRVLLVALALAVGTGFWVERPLLMGLVLMGLVLLAAEGRVDVRWLVPVMWVWANVHGSFPLGLVALGCFALGRRLDGESPATELRALRWAAAGTALAVVGPLGARVLTFPVELLSRSELLQYVIEWQSPAFTSQWQRLYLLQVAVALAGLVRRPTWRAGVPLVVFLFASLLAARNIPVASLVLLPGTARALAGLGQVPVARRLAFGGRVAAVALVGLGGLVAASAFGRGAFDLRGYPVEVLDRMERDELLGPGARVVTEDFVGNYREAVDGADARVFFDDRYDMFPESVITDYITLKRGRHGWDGILERWDATAVLWSREQPLAELLRLSDDWRVVHRDDAWIVAVRR